MSEAPQARARNNRSSAVNAQCKICGYTDSGESDAAYGSVRGNTQRFIDQTFNLWKCAKCLSVHSLDPVDFKDIYSDYPLNQRRLDVFARGTLRHLHQRLVDAGLQPGDSILDYGCGNGLFVQFLKELGHGDVSGYDPFIAQFSQTPADGTYHCVVANDVIEHVADPRALVADCARLVRPGGLLYLGTADSEPVDMKRLAPEAMRMHQPFHRIMLTQAGLEQLALESGFEMVARYRRSYMDTRKPFSNYRFLDEFNKALGYNMDRALDPAAGKVILRKPQLLFYAFFGYWLPSAYEPAVVMRKPQA